MSKPEFVYTTYIETSAEKLWLALTDGDFTERYWFGHRISSDWEAGSPYIFTRHGAMTISTRAARRCAIFPVAGRWCWQA